jgi:hypothetical protein
LIDFAAIPPGTLDIDLPEDGSLLFFSEAALGPEDSRALYIPAGTPVAEAEPPDDDLVYDRFPLYSSLHWTMPGGRDESIVDLGESRYDEQVFRDIEWRLDAGGGTIALGGYTTPTTGGRGDPMGSPERDVMLAQLYLRDDIVGEDFECELVILYCMITRDDLAARRFDRIRFDSDFNG